MERFSNFLASKKKLALEKKKKEEEELRIEAQKRTVLSLPTSSLRDAMLTPRSPRELINSPRPLPEDIMKEAAPTKEKKRRASLNGTWFLLFNGDLRFLSRSRCFLFVFPLFFSCPAAWILINLLLETTGQYIVGKELGKGSSGIVSMAINKSTGEIVAVKTVPKVWLLIDV